MKHDKKNITAMVTGMVIGAALASEAAAGIVAEPTWQKIYVDGRQVSMTSYNIAGNNYVRLRDIGQQVDFNVYWSDGVQIDTDAPYTGIAPVQEISSQPTDMEIREEMIRRITRYGRSTAFQNWRWISPSWMRHRNAPPTCTPAIITKRNVRLWQHPGILTASAPT